MAPTDYTYHTARAALDALVSAWPAPGDAEPLPEQRYVAYGQVAVDCEQVTASFVRTFHTDGDAAVEQILSGQLAVVRVVVVELAIIRCAPTFQDDQGTPPTAEQIEASAYTAGVDCDTMHVIMAGAGVAGCSGAAIEGWRAIGPSDYGGGALTVRLML